MADELGVSRRSVQRLFERFRRDGEAAVAPDYERCGQCHPRQAAPQLLEKARRLREEHFTWGAELIRVIMHSEGGGQPLPATRTLQRHFRRCGVAPAPPGRRVRTSTSRATQPHQVWQVDASEQMKLASGRGVSWMRYVDEFSGAVLDTKVYDASNINQIGLPRLRRQARGVFSRWGRPFRLRVDNGYPWGSWGDFPPELSLWLWGLDVEIIWNPPRQPQCNGVVERSQGVGKNWTEPSRCRTLKQLQRRLDRMDQIQRETYPSVHGMSRMTAFPELAYSGREYNAAWEGENFSHARALQHLAEYLVARKVSPGGHVSVYSRTCYVGKHHRGKSIYVYLDPEQVSWVFATSEGAELRVLPAPELSRRRIQRLDVAYHRPSRPKPK